MIRFLKKFFVYLTGLTDQAGGLPQHIADAESVTRFIFSDKNFSVDNRRVKRHAFSAKGGETSVFRIANLTNDLIWEVGRELPGEIQGSPRARADLTAYAIRGAKLDVLSAPKRHPRHANIVNWPEDKEKRRLSAMDLANASSLQLPS